MTKTRPARCSILDIYEWDIGPGWSQRTVDLHEILSHDSKEDGVTASPRPAICIIFASANIIRKCELCRGHFIDKFKMPKVWWSDYSKKSNGYFGCQRSRSPNGQESFDTWTYFEIKKLEPTAIYSWYKLNIFVRWDGESHQTVVLAFDTPYDIAQSFRDLLVAPDPRDLHSPFWFYPHLLSEVARHQEAAVWAIRNQVREVEKQTLPLGRPNPDYRNLHDIARHALHVSETLEVAVKTIKSMLDRHRDLWPSLSDFDAEQGIHSQLQFFESYISSLSSRSASNEKRMLNEIQLAFNTVAQHDASTSVKIGLATQADSLTMKSIALVTLTFLPPTFVSAIFSMSFFDNSTESGWVLSEKFWIYWVFAIPTTLFTVAAWYFLQKKYSAPAPLREEKFHALNISISPNQSFA
ncbi:hypothetical protein F5B22DRAFT_368605 [Xylaria bambusicola]|uniref:uncharacterized protein n=1 Tax=Xylaria bambusicola TaxID=326684 RepID=UPI0020086E7A|nr:uncharacterized protein F5B22DRAFT_368605 [Xylaria bambusicola]KAI0509254.1 hypothetical protein F5B22DRAFT_368605 [Xylaria bambusicola]